MRRGHPRGSMWNKEGDDLMVSEFADQSGGGGGEMLTAFSCCPQWWLRGNNDREEFSKSRCFWRTWSVYLFERIVQKKNVTRHVQNLGRAKRFCTRGLPLHAVIGLTGRAFCLWFRRRWRRQQWIKNTQHPARTDTIFFLSIPLFHLERLQPSSLCLPLRTTSETSWVLHTVAVA